MHLLLYAVQYLFASMYSNPLLFEIEGALKLFCIVLESYSARLSYLLSHLIFPYRSHPTSPYLLSPPPSFLAL